MDTFSQDAPHEARQSKLTVDRPSTRSDTAVACYRTNFKTSRRQMEGKCHPVAKLMAEVRHRERREDVLDSEGL